MISKAVILLVVLTAAVARSSAALLQNKTDLSVFPVCPPSNKRVDADIKGHFQHEACWLCKLCGFKCPKRCNKLCIERPFDVDCGVRLCGRSCVCREMGSKDPCGGAHLRMKWFSAPEA